MKKFKDGKYAYIIRVDNSGDLIVLGRIRNLVGFWERLGSLGTAIKIKDNNIEAAVVEAHQRGRSWLKGKKGAINVKKKVKYLLDKKLEVVAGLKDV